MYDIQHVKRRFFALNLDRLRRTQQGLRLRHRDFLKLLPLFFHVNHPILPGYVSGATPKGISNYNPTKSSLLAARRLAKSFSYKRRAYPKYDIFSIFLTGSTGSIAYSAKSDFDIWVCHDPRLDTQQRSELQEKARGIEHWALQQGLEIHIFIFDEYEFKNRQHGEVDNDSSGSAQHHLLLEEFYRSGLLVAGRYPIWWLVPPEHELDYDDTIEELTHKRFIRNNESVDLGGIGVIPAGEFFGASLWQLSKGIESPYKSILKIQLMETYADSYPDYRLLSTQYKDFVYGDEYNINQVDPYIMMCKHIDNYLEQRHEHDRQELMRRCMYFKTNLRLSRKVSHDDAWRYEAMKELTDNWGWDNATIQTLDTRDSWKVERVMEEKNLLVNELTQSYRVLSAFAKQHSNQNLINEADMTKLGRKLYAYFERKQGKIEVLNPDISPNLHEDMLTFSQTTSTGQEIWSVHRGSVASSEIAQSKPLKQTSTLIELIAWAYFNTLIGRGTRIRLYSSERLKLRELKEIILTFSQDFHRIDARPVGLEEYEKTSFPVHCTLFVNIAVDPMYKLSVNGQHLISNRSDAFNYSGLSENLVMTFDQVAVSNWKEIIYKRYEGVTGIMQCITEYIQACVGRGAENIHPLKAYSFSSTLSATISKRVTELFDNISEYYLDNKEAFHKRYIIQVDNVYYVIQMSQQAPYYQRVPSYDDLIDLLAYPQQEYSEVKFDSYINSDSLLPVLYSNQNEGRINVYYFCENKQARVYIIDEKGSLFTQTMEFFNHETLMVQLDRFLSSVIKRICIMQNNPLLASPISEISFFRLYSSKQGAFRAEKQSFRPFDHQSHYTQIEAVLEADKEGKTYYRLYCDDMEFSVIQYGRDMYLRMAEYILSRRSDFNPYPIYITDLDISGALQDNNYCEKLQTVHFLDHKQHIENLLNEALTTLLSGYQQQLQYRLE